MHLPGHSHSSHSGAGLIRLHCTHASGSLVIHAAPGDSAVCVCINVKAEAAQPVTLQILLVCGMTFFPL